MYGRRLQLQVSKETANLLHGILENADDHPAKCHCCIHKPDTVPWKVLLNITIRNCKSCISRYLYLVYQTSPAPSSSAQRYTPSDTGSSNSPNPSSEPSRNRINDKVSCIPSTNAPHAASTCCPSPPEASSCTRLLFATGGMRWSLELDRILVTDGSCDSTIFRKLREFHRTHRPALLHWVSPFRFKSCKCVKVRSAAPFLVALELLFLGLFSNADSYRSSKYCNGTVS